MSSKVDTYFARSKTWRAESAALREILLDCDLDEQLKWGKPCYSHQGKNIVIIQKMKAFVALMFFKGALLKDTKGVLKQPGESSRSQRRFELTSVREVTKARALIKRYVREAIENERAGLKVAKPDALVLPGELTARFKRDRALAAAFQALTPGRQRFYGIYFSAPKGAEARVRRIDKYAPKILAGKGFHDR